VENGSERQRGLGRRQFDTLLTARRDQLYLNLLGAGELLEQCVQVQLFQSIRALAVELIVRVNITVGLAVGMVMGVSLVLMVFVVMLVMIIVMRVLAAGKQRAFQRLLGDLAVGGLQAEKRQGLLQAAVCR
jgi:aromatic ring hydroxylase